MSGAGEKLINVASEVAPNVGYEGRAVREWAFTLIGELGDPSVEKGVSDLLAVGGVLDVVIGGVGEFGGVFVASVHINAAEGSLLGVAAPAPAPAQGPAPT